MKYTVSPPESLPDGLTRTIVTVYPSDGAPFTEEFITNIRLDWSTT